MTESPAQAVEAPTTRKAVYDNAETRFVDPVAGETAAETAKRLNTDSREAGPKFGQGDGKRYSVVDV